MTKDAALRLASTVVLLAPSLRTHAAQSDYRVLMMKRAKTMRFMPGVHVFPGGAIDAIDRDERWAGLLGEETPKTLLAERVGAVRETFEEAGILLAKPAATVAQIPKEELAHWRKQVLADGSNFLTMCERYQIRPAVNDLIEWSVWITPTFETRRFYTRFFLALLPSLPTDALHENNENTTTDWLRPEEALELFRKGDITLIPPQFYTMTELAGCRSMQHVPALRTNHTIVPIQPEFLQTDDGTTVSALPGDPLHPSGAGHPHHRHRILFGPGGGMFSSDMRLVKDLSDPPIVAASKL